MNLQVVHDRQEVAREPMEKHENLDFFKVGDRFIKLFTALECILIFNNREPISHNIAERAALLLVKGYDNRRDLKRNIKTLYRLRGDIVHCGEIFISNPNLEYLVNVVQATIITILKLKNTKKLNNRQDLEIHLEKLKLS